MHRLMLLVAGSYFCGLLGITPGLGQESTFPPIAPPEEEVRGTAPSSSPYALPRSSRSQRLLDSRPAVQPPMETPIQSHELEPSGEAVAGDESAIEQTQFVAPQELAPTKPIASGQAAAQSQRLPDVPQPQPTPPPTAAATPAPSANADARQKGSPPSPSVASSAMELTGLAGLKEWIPTSPQDAWKKLVGIWRYEIFMKVTVETISIALVLLFLGYVAAKRISAWFASRILGRLGIARNNVATIQTIGFYALMAAFTLSTLGALGVPVTVFSFFGGALAVGIGFGSQNIVNNFISGLILLAERPIRVGDVIQIDGATGKVTEIGARSTRITTGSNMEILVPNSTFLQNNVINWTLSDDVISSKISVGVAYGSPARRVASLLLQAAQENADVLANPAPGVSLTNFGAYALEFELSFWVRLSQADRGKVESDLRFAIDDLFATHGIIIAYPQRDVHLNLLRPVEVRLTPPASELRRAAA